MITKFERRLTAWTMAGAMMLTNLAGAPVLVSAKEAETEDSQVEALLLEEGKTGVVESGSSLRYCFAPEAAGTYTITTIGDRDTYGQVYLADGTLLQSDNDSGEGLNYAISLNCEAGETYYVESRFFVETETGEIETLVQKQEAVQDETLLSQEAEDMSLAEAETELSETLNPAADVPELSAETASEDEGIPESEEAKEFIMVGQTSGAYEYDVLEDGTIRITKYTGSDAEVVIPGSIDGKTVTVIGPFDYNSWHKTSDGKWEGADTGAFAGNQAIKKVTIPASVTSIEYGAFASCTNLTEVVFVKDGELESISAGAFIHTNLQAIDLPNKVKRLGSGAFSYTKLKEVSIPVGLESYVIWYRYGGSIAGAFANCSELKKLTFESGRQVICGDLCARLSAEELELNDELMFIGSCAFLENEKLTKLTIPSRVIDIEYGAFAYNSKLNTLNLDTNLEFVGEDAFLGCEALTEVMIPASVKEIGEHAFGYTTDIRPESWAVGWFEFDGGITSEYYIEGEGWLPYSKVNSSLKWNNESFQYEYNGKKVLAQRSVNKDNGKVYHRYLENNEWKEITYTKIPNFTIIGYAGTAAETYAKENGFIFKEFKNSTPTKAFATRLYEKCLGREPEEAGLLNWDSLLVSKASSGAAVAQGFVFSKEYQQKNTSDEEFVEMLYNVLMDRASDAGGKAYWLELLSNGVSREYVFHGFAESQEFTNICKAYDIERGSVTLSQARDKNPKVTAYVNRMYTKALNRQGEENGLNDWCNRIQTGSMTPEQVAEAFINSQEFKNKNLSNEEYIKVLYRAFMGREYDAAGLEHWKGKLANGSTREAILHQFSISQEFKNIQSSFGL